MKKCLQCHSLKVYRLFGKEDDGIKYASICISCKKRNSELAEDPKSKPKRRRPDNIELKALKSEIKADYVRRGNAGEMAPCKYCGNFLNLLDFSRETASPTGFREWCRSCKNKLAREKYNNDPEVRRKRSKYAKIKRNTDVQYRERILEYNRIYKLKRIKDGTLKKRIKDPNNRPLTYYTDLIQKGVKKRHQIKISAADIPPELSELKRLSSLLKEFVNGKPGIHTK
jgi:hypothetical protein